VKSDESESDMPAMRSPVKRTPRASSAKHARASDTETGTDLKGVRKSVSLIRDSALVECPYVCSISVVDFFFSVQLLSFKITNCILIS
jgi:hypothetical protein